MARAKGWDEFKAAKESIGQICEHVLSGESLLSFCKAKGFPYVTVLDWIGADPARTENYARAREARAEMVFESLDEVSEQAVTAETAVEVAGLRLKADNIKWKLARMAPKKYGDKVDVNHSGAIARPVTDLTDDELAAIAAGRSARTAEAA